MEEISRESVEPVEVEGVRLYKCPICDYKTLGSLQEAREHANTPLSSGCILPRGFIFGRNYHKISATEEFCIVDSSRRVSSAELETIKKDILEYGLKKIGIETLTTHDFDYIIEVFERRMREEEEEIVNKYGESVYSSGLLKQFMDRTCYLLTEEQVEEFKRKRIDKYSRSPLTNEELRRNLEGIERWIVER